MKRWRPPYLCGLNRSAGSRMSWSNERLLNWRLRMCTNEGPCCGSYLCTELLIIRGNQQQTPGYTGPGVHCWHMPTSRESPAQLHFLKHQGGRLVTLSRGSWKASSLKLKIYPKSYILSSTVSIIKCQTQFMGACPTQILGSEVDVK